MGKVNLPLFAMLEKHDYYIQIKLKQLPIKQDF